MKTMLELELESQLADLVTQDWELGNAIEALKAKIEEVKDEQKQ